MGLDQRGAALHPVAVVAVEDAVDVAHLGMVDVAADHAVDAAPARFARERLLEVADEADGVLDLVLEVVPTATSTAGRAARAAALKMRVERSASVV